MRYAFGSQARSRFVALALLGVVLGACVTFFRQAADADSARIVNAFSIAGEWEFHNGPIEGESTKVTFPDRVEVPKPLPESIVKNLADEYWYRTRVKIPSDLQREGVALYLGSIKGAHEVFWNGLFLGAGGDTSIGIYRVPVDFIRSGQVVIEVKVRKGTSIFPGIVSMDTIAIGDSGKAPEILKQYYFDTGVRPLLPTVLKLALFFIFIGFFISVPYKREYLSFSLFTFFSAVSSAFYSRFVPGYEDYFFRNSMIFTGFCLSLAFVPMVAADLWRLPEMPRRLVRMWGFACSLLFLLAATMVHAREQLIPLFRLANTWLPAVTLLPCALAGLCFAIKLDPALVHRRVQIAAFSLFMLLGVATFGSGAASFLKFILVEYREFFDFAVSVGLAISLAMDFRFTDLRSRQASKSIPKWFSVFLSRGIDQVTLELPLIVLAVDTVGYTKKLSSISGQERESLHAAIRRRLAAITEVGNAQKISERGDGGIFAWDFPETPEQRAKVLMEVFSAARRLNGDDGSIQFRAGISFGRVRGELRDGDISFLGEALNIASRLEAMAEPGMVLVDLPLSELVQEVELGPENKKAELKGVTYQARPLNKAA